METKAYAHRTSRQIARECPPRGATRAETAQFARRQREEGTLYARASR